MTVTVKTTDGGLGFIMKGEGVVSGQEILCGVAKRFSSEKQIKKYIYGISDYTEVEQIQMSSDEVKLVAQHDIQVAKINPNLVIAIAAPKDVMFGLSRMFQSYADDTGWVIGVFRTLEEAKRAIVDKLKEIHVEDIKINFDEYQ